ncbi:MAG: GHKL domain-containing protein, partial [Bacteroidota bacterium]
VSLHKELEHIENYISLEKIRYGRRVVVNFDTFVKYDAKIAPLLLLTFIENAFKHGVSQEINQAKIDMTLRTDDRHIYFEITNTIPKNVPMDNTGSVGIGLSNVRKQLELLYPDAHQLTINATPETYTVQLEIQKL